MVEVVPGARLREVVAWPIDRNTAWSLWNTVVHDFLLTAGSVGNPSRGATKRLPADPDAVVPLGDLAVARSQGDSRPLHFDWTQVPLFVSQRAAWIDTSAAARDRRYLPLEDLRIESARSLDRVPRRQARSRWALELSGGSGDLNAFEIHGSWLALAYVATIAGWPEPASRNSS